MKYFNSAVLGDLSVKSYIVSFISMFFMNYFGYYSRIGRDKK